MAIVEVIGEWFYERSQLKECTCILFLIVRKSFAAIVQNALQTANSCLRRMKRLTPIMDVKYYLNTIDILKQPFLYINSISIVYKYHISLLLVVTLPPTFFLNRLSFIGTVAVENTRQVEFFSRTYLFSACHDWSGPGSGGIPTY